MGSPLSPTSPPRRSTPGEANGAHGDGDVEVHDALRTRELRFRAVSTGDAQAIQRHLAKAIAAAEREGARASAAARQREQRRTAEVETVHAKARARSGLKAASEAAEITELHLQILSRVAAEDHRSDRRESGERQR